MVKTVFVLAAVGAMAGIFAGWTNTWTNDRQLSWMWEAPKNCEQKMYERKLENEKARNRRKARDEPHKDIDADGVIMMEDKPKYYDQCEQLVEDLATYDSARTIQCKDATPKMIKMLKCMKWALDPEVERQDASNAMIHQATTEARVQTFCEPGKGLYSQFEHETQEYIIKTEG